jgi:hypothetical protein
MESFISSRRPLLYVVVCPKFNCHVYKLKGRLLGNKFVSTLQLGVQSGASIGGCSMFQKNLLMGR